MDFYHRFELDIFRYLFNSFQNRTSRLLVQISKAVFSVHIDRILSIRCSVPQNTMLVVIQSEKCLWNWQLLGNAKKVLYFSFKLCSIQMRLRRLLCHFTSISFLSHIIFRFWMFGFWYAPQSFRVVPIFMFNGLTNSFHSRCAWEILDIFICLNLMKLISAV